MGKYANLGAGTKLSNYKIAEDKTITLNIDGQVIDTGLIKFGAILGDGVNTGCNSVLNPGTLVGTQLANLRQRLNPWLHPVRYRG